MCFIGLDATESKGEVDHDFWMYFNGFAAIGAVTGFAGWYFARLSALQHLSMYGVSLILMIPYLFILMLAFDKNPFIAVFSTAVFGFVLGMAWAGRQATMVSGAT